MYESPIDIIYGEMQTQIENDVLKAVQRVSVNVNKEELLKALQYDREQYSKGYENGLNANRWIPCSERLPEKRDWYLAIFKEPDTGFIALPYIAEYLMGNHTAYTTNDGWIIKDCTDICDRESLYHKNLECVAWMPLPDPMKIME